MLLGPTAMLLLDVLQNVDTIASGRLMGGCAALAVLHGQARIVGVVQSYELVQVSRLSRLRTNEWVIKRLGHVWI